MSNFIIMTDSCANISQERVEGLGLYVLSLSYLVDGVEKLSYAKDLPFDPAAFYGQLRKKVSASTSQATPAQALDYCRPIFEGGKDILYIGFSSGLSGTFHAIKTAIDELLEEFPERKAFCVDTCGATIGFGRLVLDAAKMRDEGKALEDIYAWLEENKLKALHYFTVDDLFHLQRGGRMSAVKAIMGSALNIKPLLTVSNQGKLVPIGKAKGRKKSLEWLADKTIDLIDVNMSNKIFMAHGDSLEDAEYTAKLIKEKNPSLEIEIMGLDPVIGVHSGPGTISLFFMSQHAREA